MNTTSQGPWSYLFQRLHEKSTYLMIPILLGLYGVHVSGPTMQLMASIGISLSGLALALIPENGAQRSLTVSVYLTARLQEPTTYAAIPVILGAIGVHLDNAVLHNISQIGIAVGGVGAFLIAEPGTPLPTPPATLDTPTVAPASLIDTPIIPKQPDTTTSTNPAPSGSTTS